MTDELKKIMELLNDPTLSNSARLGILLSLYILGKSTFSDLQRSSGISKSSLFMHLQVLEESGLITVKKVPTLSGPRTIIEITEKGIQTIKQYIDLIKKIQT
ncbi:transcriptional regulator [Acidianus brierleyi]|uniref:ArsR family transcriptional regulator n=1 Tax=Acidianus brierleyi TaxID=41673 RepID=A0A2U9IB45_9CREN|nr:transcriptional regulator [Acidianus brierleyi]AWR93247.1 ArsR family transcriptional regulator [Acidianus brierleyi]